MKSGLAMMAALLVVGLALGIGCFAQNSKTSGQAPAAGAGTAPAQHLPQAKSKEELDAYNAAAQMADPSQLESAADAFAQKYPNSELRSLLYVRAMNEYQRAGSTQKVIEMGRKAIALDPTNPVPLVNVASALSEDTKEGDPNRQQNMEEAAKDAHAAIDNMNTGLQIPPGTPQDRVDMVKSNISAMAYDALGVVDMDKKDYAAAEADLQKGIEATKAHPDAVLYLRLSVAQDKLGKYPQALESANNALKYAQEGSPEQNLAKQQQARVQKLMSEQGGAGMAPASSANPTNPTPGAPTNSQTAPGATTTPH